MVDKLSKALDPIRTGPATGTALGEAQAQFDRVANRLRLDPATTALLRTPMREHHFVIPVRMDDGTSQNAAYLIAIERVARACHERGWV